MSKNSSPFSEGFGKITYMKPSNRKPSYTKTKDNCDEINICLNCTEAKCIGVCDKIKFRNDKGRIN